MVQVIKGNRQYLPPEDEYHLERGLKDGTGDKLRSQGGDFRFLLPSSEELWDDRKLYCLCSSL